MSSCTGIDAIVTPYVDGELDHDARGLVDAHLQGCAVCRARVTAERAAYALVKRRQADLRGVCAPDSLRERCAALRRAPVVPWSARAVGARLRPSRSTRPMVRLAFAATVLIAVAGTIFYRVTAGAQQAIAAELTADHAKCFALNSILRTHQSVGEVEAYLRSGFDWEAALPEQAEHADMHLVGSRPCLYERGLVAHIMYRHRGVPVSIFMLPGVQHASNVLRAFGHDAIIWNDHGRTFVLIAKASPEQVQQVATFVRASLH
ncbi:MAG: hypothetical protein FJW27_10860 [Acidimicrobiia bacterium]|nr:hypothetical protein [Acidimicrobiia bacterium]